MIKVVLVVLFLVGVVVLTAKQPSSNVPSTSAAPTTNLSAVSEAGSAKAAISNLDIKDFKWGAEYGVMTVSLVFDNKGDYDVKDISLICRHAAPSGTAIDSNRRTIYEVVPARSKKAIREFNMGFIHSQAKRSGCAIDDLVVGAYRAPPAAKPKKDATTTGAAPAKTPR
jgi:hypothetical protein